MLRLRKIIPELNRWFGNTLLNNDITLKHVNYPVKLGDVWRCKDSVVELLFNECADPSGREYDGHHYIYKYKTVHLQKIYPVDPTLHRRIQICLNNLMVFAANDPNNSQLQSIFNLANPVFSEDRNGSASNNSSGGCCGCNCSNIEVPPLTIDHRPRCCGTDEIAQNAGVKPTKNVKCYDSVIVTTGTDELYWEGGKCCPCPDCPGPSVYSPDENVFGLIEEELEMLEYLYYYRVGEFERIHCFPCNFYYELRSPLSKWIYLYLQCYMFNTIEWRFLNSIADPHDNLRSMYEKHAQDRIYQYAQKHHYTIWNDIQDIGGNQLRRVFEDHTMPCHSYIYRKRLTNNDIKNGRIELDVSQNQQPISKYQFEFIYDGLILQQGKDYDLVNDGNLKEVHVAIQFKDPSKFKSKTRYHLMWSALEPSTPFNRDGIKTSENCCCS